jgi:hypothetical protein
MRRVLMVLPQRPSSGLVPGRGCLYCFEISCKEASSTLFWPSWHRVIADLMDRPMLATTLQDHSGAGTQLAEHADAVKASARQGAGSFRKCNLTEEQWLLVGGGCCVAVLMPPRDCAGQSMHDRMLPPCPWHRTSVLSRMLLRHQVLTQFDWCAVCASCPSSPPQPVPMVPVLHVRMRRSPAALGCPLMWWQTSTGPPATAQQATSAAEALQETRVLLLLPTTAVRWVSTDGLGVRTCVRRGSFDFSCACMPRHAPLDSTKG